MTERKALLDQNETPEDVASLYTWANLHGAKYRDFSAARAQAREKNQQRAEKTAVEAQARISVQAEVERPQILGAGPVSASFTVQAATQQVRPVVTALATDIRVPAAVTTQSPEVQPERRAPQATPSVQDKLPLVRDSQVELPRAETQVHPQASFFATKESSEQPAAASASSERRIWGAVEVQEAATTPAWLNTEHAKVPVAPSLSQTGEESLLASSDRLASRWFALKGVFQGDTAVSEQVPAVSHAPVVAVFSLAGGVGKTSMVATLGRALSAHGERVLLVDTASYGLLPFYFGACDQRPGQLRTFTPPGASSDAPIQMITIDADSLGPEKAPQDSLTAEIGKYSGNVSRVIVDLATASGATTRRVLRMSPLVLVPVTPDMNSVVSVHAIESFFQRSASNSGACIKPYYVLNQFDSSLPLHLDVREVLREQLRDRLLPFSLRRTSAVSEALAEGMTIMDYSPASAVAEDYENLAGWIKNQSAPLSSGFRGVRWSER